MLVVPIQDVPAQSLTVTLGGQICEIDIYCKDGYGIFLDLSVSDAPIVIGVICQNLNRIVRDLYLNFQGDLVFSDQQGSDDPVSPGLGTRFQLCYLELSDLGGAG